MKIYLDKNVYEAAKERLNFIFDEFEHIYISLSGGKDSSVMLQIANQVAKYRDRKFDVMFIDYEAQYQATIDHVNELKKLSQINQFYHIAMHFKANNASSVFRRFWYPWDPKEKAKWVRDLPDDAITSKNHPFGDRYHPDLFLRGLFKMFSSWYKDFHNTDKVANLQGLRADESMNRFRAMAFGKNLYKGKNYSTDNRDGVYSFYPIYDMSTEDVWHCVSRFNFSYNQVYEMLWKNGVGIHEQRIAQPYGLRQMDSLNQWSILEPETWRKVVDRVSGANFGALYAKTSLLGRNGTSKPDHMSYEEYTVFLLESLGLYSPDLMHHYYRKIKIYIDHYIEEGRISHRREIPEEISKDEVIEKHKRDNGRWIQWKRIARCIEKNDFALSGCNYGITKADKEDMQKLKDKWGSLLGIEEYGTKAMNELAKQIGYEAN